MTGLIIPLLAVLLCPIAQARDTRELVYVGTYTGKGSEGIYAFRFDPLTGEAGPVHLAARTDNPSFLAIDHDGEFLYAVNELDTFQGEASGAVSAFEIDQDSDTLKPLQQVSSLGAAPAHLSLDQSGEYLLVANYNGGNVAVFPIQKDGQLGPHSAFVQEKGKSVNRKRQAGPHAHFIQATPDNRFALNADLGLDKVFVYRFNSSTGSLSAGDPPFARMKPGSGPRHAAFAPSAPFVYVLNELASTITVFSFNADSGTLHEEQTLPSLPKSFRGKNTAAEIQVDVRGRFLYVSNRGHDSLGLFSIDPDSGTLKPIQWIASGGKIPRHFAIDPSGRWLLAANQTSNTINTFRVDTSSGLLSMTTASIAVPVPVFVGFVPPEEIYISTEVAAVLPSAQEEVGDDPTVLRSRLELGDEYFNNAGTPDWHLVTARIDGAASPRLAFRLDIPYMFLDSAGGPYSPDSGLADIMFRTSAVIEKTTHAGFTGFCDFWFNTAESKNFGLGKYSAGPGIIISGMNPYKDFIVSGLFQHKFSYAGDVSRTDINRTKFEVIMDQSLRDRYWLVLDPVIYLDWEDHQRTAGDLEVEAGMRLGTHWSAWARPGVGLWGQAVSGGYDSYLQAGIRYVFGQPFRNKVLKEFGLQNAASKEW